MQLCWVEHLLNTYSTYLSSILDSPSPMFWLHSVESNIDDKYVEKVFNKCSTRQSCIFPKFTSFKIGTLVDLRIQGEGGYPKNLKFEETSFMDGP